MVFLTRLIRRAGTVVLATAMSGLSAGSLHAQATPGPISKRDTTKARALDTLKVVGRVDDLTGIARSASEGRVGAVDLRSRPIVREGELLETIPGMVVTQHSGEGKANQYFVRGFNLDHGTDFQTRVEGMPVNMASHAHGQGYTDLNFLIPEFVDYLDYKLGVYHTEVGDFGSAGGAAFHLLRKLDRPFSVLSAGEHGMARVALGQSTRVGAGDLLIGGEAKRYDGPWELAERIRKYSGLARYSWKSGPSQFSVLGMAYRNDWNSNDQIPLRAVEDGLITRFGQIDKGDGGRTQRYSLSGSWRHVGVKSLQDVQLFGIYSDLSLYSNFTYFLENPDRGDQFNQREHRAVVGGNASTTRFVQSMGAPHQLKVGVQVRSDIINGLGLYHTEQQVRFGTVRQDDVRESTAGLYVEAESRWRPWFRSVLGVRADGYAFSVQGDNAENSGNRRAGIVSPKASLVFSPSASTELYLSGGLGFHSNDARGTTITVDPVTGDPASRVDPLVRSRGGEAGVRITSASGLRTTVSAWMLNLDSELLFIGDGGGTEPSDESRRSGVTWANFFRPIPQLAVDADVSIARARFAGVPATANHIPGALENVVAAGIAWTPHARGTFGALRVRHFGSYPLIVDNSVRARSTTLLSGEVGYLLSSGVRIDMTVLNLLNAQADDIQYFYPSRLQGEPLGGSDDVHFHPIEPRQLRVSLSWAR